MDEYNEVILSGRKVDENNKFMLNESKLNEYNEVMLGSDNSSQLRVCTCYSVFADALVVAEYSLPRQFLKICGEIYTY